MSVNSVNADGSLTKIAGSGSTDTSVLKGDFSVVESTSTATRAYSIGDCFIMETGQLVRATSAIAINDTIAIGTNVAATSVTELLDNKVDKEQGKGLSTNDYNDTEKSKVASITDKASKVQGSTSGNLAGLDSNGDLIDANWSADKTTQSATGNPISISGLKSNQLAVNPIITLEPIQAGSGTPSPSNVRAISGYDKIEVLSCGVNVWDGKYSEENKFLNADGTLTSTNGWYVTSYVPVKANTSYTVSYAGNGLNGSSMCWYNSAKEFIASKTWSSAKEETISMPSNAKYLRVSYHSSTYNFQIEENNTKTTYEPCNKTTDLSEALGQTVYGGTWYLRTGLFTVTQGIVDLGTLEWTKNTTNNVFYASFSGNANRSSDAKGYKYVSDRFVYGTEASDLWNNGAIGLCVEPNAISSALRIYARHTAYDSMTAEQFKTAVSGSLLAYELEISIEIQLTPHEISLLKDYAYVSTNGTSMSFSYHNGEMASLGDVSQLGETVNELGSLISKTDFGTRINLATYSQTEPYLTLCDGYVVVYSNGNGIALVNIAGTNEVQDTNTSFNFGIFTAQSGIAQGNSIYVKKGMKLSIPTSSPLGTGSTARFYPLNG